MADIHIERCTIRVVRHGGWSWGPEPQLLVDRVKRQLPRLLAGVLGQFWRDERACEIAEPIRLRINLPLASFRSLIDDQAVAGQSVTPARSAVAERVTAALREALAAALPADPMDARPHDEMRSAPSATNAASTPFIEPTDPLRVLCAWFAQGCVVDRLNDFSFPALSAWYAHIFARPPSSGMEPALPRQVAERVLRQVASQAEPGTDEAAVLRARLIACAALQTIAPGALCSPVLRDLIALILPLASTPPGGTPLAVPAAPEQPPAGTAAELLPGSDSVIPSVPLVPLASLCQRRRAMAAEWQIDTALPFLLLNPLTRIGYLDAVGASLAAAGRTDALPLFAAALAYKVLPPPVRGWLRARSAATVAAFALLEEPPQDSEIAAFGPAISPYLSPLGAVLASTLIDGHRAGTPLLLTAVDAPPGRLLLSDVDGTFPIALDDGVLPALKRLLQEIVLVDAQAATPALLSALDRAGIRFVTNALPGRSERWHPIGGRPGKRWWTNDGLTPAERLRAAARLLAPAAEMAAACWQEIGAKRPSVPRLREDTFDSALTLAAAIALGTIAWELWRERETTSPPLALARFHDFEARIRVDAGTVRVLLPLGRRFFDLSEHGLLEDVAGVPWFGGRIVQFRSG